MSQVHVRSTPGSMVLVSRNELIGREISGQVQVVHVPAC
jgi:hypothetical protein